MLYKTGDVLMVDPDLTQGTRGSVSVVQQMTKFAGMAITIKSIGPKYYKIVEDHDNWCWSEECFVSPIKSADEAFDAFVKGNISKITYETILKTCTT
jgi:hypothetical protein